MVPYDPRKPLDPSGIRLGTPAATTRGMKEAEMQVLADIIDLALRHKDDTMLLQLQKERIQNLCKKFPIYP